MFRYPSHVLCVCCALFLLSGCTSTDIAAPGAPATPVVIAVPPPPPESLSARSDEPAARASAPAQPAHQDPQHPLSTLQSMYFDFDDYAIKKDYAPLLLLHARYLAEHPSAMLRIEGHTDERGGAEYNLALGQKRADAVARSLQLLGAPARQLETTSWGKEKPRAGGHFDAAWAENRRADLIYSVP